MNESLFNFFFSFAHKSILLDDVIIVIGRYVPYVLVGAFFVLVFEQVGWRKKMFLLGEALLAVILARGLITQIIRYFYIHPRPFDALGIESLIPESGNSFPSGHMTFFFALALIVWFWNRTWGTWYLVVAFFIGIARISAGVHWPLDILGGIVVGLASAIAVRSLLAHSRNRLVAPVTLDSPAPF